jgi:hypothetical protein
MIIEMNYTRKNKRQKFCERLPKKNKIQGILRVIINQTEFKMQPTIHLQYIF